MNKDKFNLDFCMVGFPKCATTWISACLDEHPEIDFCKYKEPNFFFSPEMNPEFIKKRKEFVENLDMIELCRAKNLEEYEKLFKNDGKIRGESSIWYIYDTNIPKLLKKYFPNIKIIISLRNPVDFIESIYRFSDSGFENQFGSSLEDALEKGDILRFGMYYKYVEAVYKTFGRENIHIVLQENVKKSPEKVLRDLYSFLEIESNFKPSVLNKKVNKTQEIRYKWLSFVLWYTYRGFKKIGFNFLDEFMRVDSSVYKLYARLNKVDSRKAIPEMEADTREFLEKYFKKEIAKLSDLTKLNLDVWKTNK